MKKSVLTRAIAAAVSMPLAVTQCLVPAFAAQTGGVTPKEININSFTDVSVKAPITEIADGTYVQHSEWYNTVDMAMLSLASTKSFDIDTNEFFKAILDNSGSYAPEVEMILNNIKNAKASYSSNGKITITATLENLADSVNGRCKEEIGKGIDECKYGANLTAALKDFNANCPEISGEFKAVIDLSKVSAKKGGTISAKFTDSTGKEYVLSGSDSVFDYISAQISTVNSNINAELKKIIGETAVKFDEASAKLADVQAELLKTQNDLALAQIMGKDTTELEAKLNQAVGEFNTAKMTLETAKADFENAGGFAVTKANDYFAKWTKLLNKANNKASNVLKNPKNGSFASVDEMLKAAANKAPKKAGNKMPTSVDAIAANKAFNEVYNNFADQMGTVAADAGCTYNLSIADATKFAKELSDITVSYETGDAAFMAEFADDQIGSLQSYLKEVENLDVTESVKKVEVKANLGGILAGSGDFTVDVYREFKATKGVAPTTTTPAATTTTSATTTTTSDVTTTTTSDVTTTTTSNVTTTTTTSDTTTTPEETTTTTSNVTTTPEETTTTSNVTTTEVTTTEVTTTEVTTTEVTTTEVTTTEVTTTEVTTTEVTTTEVTTTDVTTTEVTTTEVTTTEVTTTTTPAFEYKTCYASADKYIAEAGFYFSDDDNAFSKDMIKTLIVTIEGKNGEIIKDVDLLNADDCAKYGITSVGFGNATPSVVFDEEKGNVYEIPVYVNGELLKNETKTTQFVATVYIGVKGDADLDNKADASDASALLAYYANQQTGGSDPLKDASDKNLNKLALFLTDVDNDKKNDASDASYVLAYYAKTQSGAPKTAATWADVLA